MGRPQRQNAIGEELNAIEDREKEVLVKDQPKIKPIWIVFILLVVITTVVILL